MGASASKEAKQEEVASPKKSSPGLSSQRKGPIPQESWEEARQTFGDVGPTSSKTLSPGREALLEKDMERPEETHDGDGRLEIRLGGAVDHGVQFSTRMKTKISKGGSIDHELGF